MKVVTAGQMRRIDELAIRERAMPGAVLMDHAGKAVVQEAVERFEPDSVIVVCGKGNNAGDGFVAARELDRRGIRTTLALLKPVEELSGDALDAYRKVPESVRRLVRPSREELQEELVQHDLLIDAIFGTGLRGPLEGEWAAVIQTINAAGVNVLSIDVPSGLSGDAALEVGPHVRAMVTVTIGRPKLGLVLDPGVRATGTVVVADVGFPNDLLEDPRITTNLMTLDEARALLPPRPPSGNKGTFGKVMILGGSEGMTGAAVLAARAAARSGAGLVYSCYPRALGPIMESHLIEPVKLPLAGAEGWFTSAMTGRVLEEAEAMDAVAIGPGLGRRPETGKFLAEIITKIKAPLVIDADALNLLAEKVELLALRPGPTVLTPHPGEAARLLDTSIAEVQKNRLEAFVAFAREYNVVTVLKGAQTITTEPGGQRWINPTGNSGLAKGGSGDVLTGLVVGLLAQGAPEEVAARLGVFLHGLAGDIAAERHGVRAMLPGDVIEAFGETFKRLQK